MAQATKKLDLNVCTVEDLQRVEGIDRKTAQAIVDRRLQTSGFRGWDDLRDIPGVGNNVMQKLRNNVTLGKNR